MKQLERYIFKVIGSSFFTIFATLFVVTSVVYLVRIAAYTSVIKINFYELFLFYAYTIPNILFFTIPISIFASIAIAFSRLSKEYELIVLSSFSLNPLTFVRLLVGPIFVVSLATVIVSIGLIPKTNYLSKTLLNLKKNESNFNISASEFGQNFGNWMIFIENDDNKTFNNIKLFKNEVNESTFILAKQATLHNTNGALNLSLQDGKTYLIQSNALRQINFSSMNITDSLSDVDNNAFMNPYHYWSNMSNDHKKAKDFSFYLLISLFPLLSLLLAISIAFYNPRYQSNHTSFMIAIFTVIYYVATYILSNKIPLIAIWIIIAIWLIINYLVYHYKIQKIY